MRLNKREQLAEKNYWKKFYRQFTDYLYDGYTGSVIKNLRTFFNYLIAEKQLPVGQFHKQFFIPKEDIPIVALSQQYLDAETSRAYNRLALPGNTPVLPEKITA